MAGRVFLVSCLLACCASLAQVQAAPEPGRKHGQPFGLAVAARVAATKALSVETVVSVDVTLKNDGQVPIIFESCECSFSNHWVSDHPLVTVKKLGLRPRRMLGYAVASR